MLIYNMSGFAQSLDQQQNTEFQSMANRGFDFLAGGVSIKSVGAAAEAEAGQSLQDTGSGLLGTATAVGIGRTVLTKVAQAKKAAQAAKAALRGGSDDAGGAGGAGGAAADDAAAGASKLLTPADIAAGNPAPAAGGAGGAGTDLATTSVEQTASEGGSILAGGADAEEVLAASGVGETPIGLVAMAGVGLVMGIAGFFMHRHAEKHAEKTTPIVQEQAGATNYFVQKGV